MTWRKNLFLPGLFLAASVMAAPPVPEHLTLFLLIGQSNMAGRGPVGARDRETNPRIFMLTKDRQWTLARDPLHFDKPTAGVGPASEFARVLAQADPSLVIGLIPCAVGGSSLDEWKVGGKNYADAVARTRVALKQGTLAGILWHQGESDSAHGLVVTYADRFAAMIAQLRQDLGAQDVPLVIGELGRFRPASTEFNAALPAIASRVPLCAYVTAENLKDRGDHLHFDTPSQYLLGERYAAAYLRLKARQAGGQGPAQ
jgi:hypothetical protein